MKRLLITMLLLVALAATTVCAGPPQLVNYQGRLTDSGGAPVNAAVPIVVGIYAQESGGTPAWDQTLGSVAVSNGLYSFQFGDENLAVALTNSACWLELVVDGETLLPRQRLVSVPYALKAAVAETALTAQSGNADTLGGQAPSGVSAAIAPPGVIWPYGGATAPDGFLLCYGQAVSRATYAALFSAVGIAYGAGDGTNTFNLPDLRGRVAAGKDNMGGTSANRMTNAVAGATLGATGGAETHTLSLAQIPNATGTMTVHGQENGTDIISVSGVFSTSTFIGSKYGNHNTQTGSQSYGPIIFNLGGGGLPHNNLQPTIILNYIIKY